MQSYPNDSSYMWEARERIQGMQRVAAEERLARQFKQPAVTPTRRARRELGGLLIAAGQALAR